MLDNPLPLMSKGGIILVLWLPSSPKGEIVDIMKQMLSFMETHIDDSSQCNRLTTKDYRSDSRD